MSKSYEIVYSCTWNQQNHSRNHVFSPGHSSRIVASSIWYFFSVKQMYILFVSEFMKTCGPAVPNCTTASNPLQCPQLHQTSFSFLIVLRQYNPAYSFCICLIQNHILKIKPVMSGKSQMRLTRTVNEEDLLQTRTFLYTFMEISVYSIPPSLTVNEANEYWCQCGAVLLQTPMTSVCWHNSTLTTTVSYQFKGYLLQLRVNPYLTKEG